MSHTNTCHTPTHGSHHTHSTPHVTALTLLHRPQGAGKVPETIQEHAQEAARVLTAVAEVSEAVYGVWLWDMALSVVRTTGTTTKPLDASS
mmetsp:Transcript_21459/g.50807  ORF Transcript_21459/g.50807 Transcript_21459/m.50807 type:complete len:91 (-) Transcript_21459:29-301(-)